MPQMTRTHTRRLFQSTLPTRGSDCNFYCYKANKYCFNPRSPRGGATSCSTMHKIHSKVSIHAPHEGERRAVATVAEAAKKCFNPRSPRGGATIIISMPSFFFESFNPRSPRGGATWYLYSRCLRAMFQSTLPTRGSDVYQVEHEVLGINVSIHAPHEGERPWIVQEIVSQP